MLGLIIYGILEKKWSLRELESLAMRDVGAWWLCGGLQPDHSTIGKFINLHSRLLTEEYFIQLTSMLVKALRLEPGDSSGDGTVIEAAASNFNTLKTEAARLAAEEAKQEAAANREDENLQKQAQKASKVAEIANKRQKARRKKGKNVNAIRVSPTEPEAAIQPLKNGARRPSYKPSVLANSDRLIVGKYMSATDEQGAIVPMLKQHKEIFGDYPSRLKLDANYCKNVILAACVSFDIDVLSPSGRAERGEWEEKERTGKYRKHRFKYDETRDVYTCPAGKELRYCDRGADAKGQRYRRYRCRECQDCQLHKHCTSDRKGRTVRRLEGDDYKEAMAQVMSDKRARKAYIHRQAEVEPVFAELRERQGLKRFRRRGPTNVALEFSLHCLAYNIKRAIGLSEVVFAATCSLQREDGRRYLVFTIVYTAYPIIR